MVFLLISQEPQNPHVTLILILMYILQIQIQ